MTCLLDTSVLLASVLESHAHHPRARSVVDEVRRGDVVGYVSAHALAELYAVLTRIPVSPSIGPEAAHRMIRDNILGNFEVVALTAGDYRRLIEELPERSVAGGATYDALHAACARKAGVDRIYTFNVSDFRRVAPDLTSKIVAP